jgi:hypothetical protein
MIVPLESTLFMLVGFLASLGALIGLLVGVHLWRGVPLPMTPSGACRIGRCKGLVAGWACGLAAGLFVGLVDWSMDGPIRRLGGPLDAMGITLLPGTFAFVGQLIGLAVGGTAEASGGVAAVRGSGELWTWRGPEGGPPGDVVRPDERGVGERPDHRAGR